MTFDPSWGREVLSRGGEGGVVRGEGGVVTFDPSQGREVL